MCFVCALDAFNLEHRLRTQKFRFAVKVIKLTIPFSGHIGQGYRAILISDTKCIITNDVGWSHQVL